MLSSIGTHASTLCTSACAALAVMLKALMEGDDKMLAVVHSTEAIYDELDPEIREVVDGSFLDKDPPQIKGSGYVVESLEAALWAFWSSDSFEEAVLKAVNLGDDADTTGAVCGQLAGAYWGRSGIPKHLLKGLAKWKMIDHVARSLIK